MKKIITLLILVPALLLGSVLCYADNANESSVSMAGASVLLNNYLKSNSNGYTVLAQKLAALKRFSGDMTAGETLEPVTYEAPKTGMVCTENTLIIREGESVLSNMLAYAYQQEEITVYGEHQVNGKLWYDVDYAGIKGHAAADFILFGNDALVYYTNLHARLKSSAVIMDKAVILDDLSGLDENSRNRIEKAVKLINYCLRTDYPKAEQSENYVNMYSILAYIAQNYQEIINLSSAFGLDETYYRAALDMQTITLIRENLVDTTGISDTEFSKQIQKAVAEREQKARYTLGEQVANYAATFINILPYVWGGASLTKGADCSGFCMQIYAHFGYFDQAVANRHGEDSTSLRRFGREIALKDIQPGDMVCYQGHVAIYYGNGMVVHEPNVGKKAAFGILYMAPIITIRRLIP